ncbi:kinesin K39 [Seminavis robusta]|uniref:Kinesin K39 n=1 Tax=Seminavis robusta TaxID=568900 RepID=A0A9N8ENV7_9STRA|nr:kinesin K39 [Seminavis robusta]|eukprot:Sro1338_g264220.1 kinesin K39 (2875) ;mRNA; r:9669-18564
MASYYNPPSGSWSGSSVNGPHAILSDSSSTLEGQKTTRHFRKLGNGKLLVPSGSASTPPQTMTKTHPMQSVAIEEGQWRGLMTVPRAVSQDEMDSPDKSASKTSIDFSTSPSTIASASSVQHHQEIQEQQELGGDASSVATSNFSSPLDRYRVDEDDGDANRTAYFSAGVGGEAETPLPSHHQTPARYLHNDNPLMETSMAISLSPQSPFVDGSLLSRVPNEDELDNHEKLSLIAEDEANFHNMAAPSEADSLSLTMQSENNYEDDLRDLEALEEEFAKDLKDVLGDIDKIGESDDVHQSNPGSQQQKQSTTDASSSLKLGSLLEATSLGSQSRFVFQNNNNNDTAEGSTMPSSLNLSSSTQGSRSNVPNQDIFVSKGPSGSPSVRALSWSLAAGPVAGGTASSLKSRSHDEIFSAVAHTVSSSQDAVINYPNRNDQDATPRWRNTSILSPPDSDESEKEETERYNMEEETTDLFGLVPKDLELSGSLDAPTSQPQVDASDNSQQQQSQHDNSSASPTLAALHAKSHAAVKGNLDLEAVSSSSTVDKGPVNLNENEGDVSETPTTTPSKSNRRLVTKVFAVQDTLGATKKSISPTARIEELEAQLEGARQVMREQKEYYEDELAKFHEFTLPLQPQSPFDPVNLKKHSPETQQRKLLERNETAIKEIRFAEVTCVELSQKNQQLEGELERRESALEKMKKEIDELKDTNLQGASNLAAQLEKATVDKLGLERQLHAAYDKMESMKNQHNSDLETVQMSVASQKEGIISELREQLKSMSSASARKEQALELQRQELQGMASDRSNLYNQIKHLNDHQATRPSYDRDEMRSKNIQLSNEVNEAKRGLQSTQTELARARAETPTLLAQVEELGVYKTRCSAMAEELERLNEKVKELELAGTIENANHDLSSVEKELEELTNERDSLSDRAAQLANDIEEANKALLSAQVDRDMFSGKVTKLSDDVEQSNRALLVMEQKLNDATMQRDEFRKQADELTATVQEARYSLKVNQQEIKNIVKERDDLRGEGKELAADLEQAHSQLHRAQQQLREVVRERDQINANSQNMSASVERAQAELKRMQQESMLLASQRDSLNGQSQKLSGALNKAQHAVQATREELRDMARERDALRSQTAESSNAAEEAQLELQRSQRDVRELIRARDGIAAQAKQLETSLEKTNHALIMSEREVQELTRERAVLEQKSSKLSSEIEEANSALLKNQNAAESATHDLELLRKDATATTWRLNEAERELKDQSATIVQLQQQVEKWKSHAEQKGPGALPKDLLHQVKKAEHKFWRDESEFFIRIEKTVAQLHSGMLSAGTKPILRSKKKSSVNPALLSQILASSSSQTLSPQVISTLQVIQKFVQQQLSMMDQKVANVVSEYADRLVKVQSTVEYIRSSLEFDSDDGSVSQSGTRETDVLDATFAAVTSIPDQQVELMEGGQMSDDEEGGHMTSTKLDPIAESPARETILDLSKIEAVSPFYSSDLTFSMDSDMDGRDEPKDDQTAGSSGPEAPPEIQQKMRLDDVQRNVFGTAVEAEATKNAGLLGTVSQLQRDLAQHQERFRSFMQLQETKLKQLEAESGAPRSVDRMTKLMMERDALSANLSQAALGLETSKAENEANRTQIATMKKEISDLEYRLVRNASSSRTNAFSSRTNSFQERLEEASNEQSSSDITSEYQHLRAELADVARVEQAQRVKIERLKEMRAEAEKANGRLKESFVRSNDKLAELAEKHELVTEELDAMKQTESQLREEVSRLAKEAQERVKQVASHDSEKQFLEQRLGQAEQEKASLDERYQQAVKSLEETKREREELQRKYDSTILDFQQSQATAEQAEEATHRIEALEKELADLRKQKEVGDEAMHKLKLSYAASSNKLAELHQERDELEQKANSAAEECNKLKETLQTIYRARDSEIEETKILEANIAAANEEMETLKTQVLGQGRELVVAKEKIASLEGGLSAARTSNESDLERIKRMEQELQSTLSACDDKVATLESQLSVATSKRERDNKEIDRLERELQSAQASHEKLKLTYVALNEKLASTTEQLDGMNALASEKEIVEQQLAQAQADLKSNREEMQKRVDAVELELQDTKNHLETGVKESDLALKEARDEVTMLRSQEETTRSENVRLQDCLHETEVSLEDLTLKFIESNNKLAEMSSENEEIANQLVLSRQAEETLQQEKTSIENDLLSLKETEASILQDKATALGERDEALKQLKSLKEAEMHLQREVEEATRWAEETQFEATAVAKERDSATNHLHAVKQELYAAQESEEGLLSEAEKLIREKDELVSNLEGTESKLQEALDSLDQAHSREQKLSQDIAVMTRKNEAAEAEATENRDAAEALGQLSEERDAMRDSIDITKQRLEEITRQMGSELKETQTKLLTSLEEGQKLCDELARTAQHRDDLEGEVEALKQRLGEVSSELEVVREESEKAREELLETTQINDSYEAEVEKLQQRLDEITAELGLDLKSSLNKLQQATEENQQLRDQVAQMMQQQNSRQAEVDFLATNQRETDEAMEKLKLSYVECNEKLANVTERNATSQATIEDLKAACSAADSLSKSTEGRLQSCMDELAATRQDRDGLELEYCKCRDQLQSVWKKHNEYRQSAVQLDRDRVNTINQIKTDKDEAIDSAQKELSQLRSVEMELRSSLEYEKHNAQDLLSQLHQVRVELEEARRAESDHERIEEKLKDTEMTLLECSSKLADEMQNSQDLLSQVDHVRVELEEARRAGSEVEADVLNLHQHLGAKEDEVTKLKKKKDIWEDRCFKLREYLRKLVAKCEEWEQCHAQQNKLLEVLEERHRQTTARANQLARSYATLNQEMKARVDPRDSSSSDCSVHDQIETELYTIASEMKNVSWTSGIGAE